MRLTSDELDGIELGWFVIGVVVGALAALVAFCVWLSV